MDRVPYRRVTPPRNSTATRTTGTSYNSQKIKPAETENPNTLLPKIIISGLLLLAVLVICTADFLEPLRGGLQDILSGAVTVQDLSERVLSFGRDQLGYAPTLYEPTPTTTPLAVPSLWE